MARFRAQVQSPALWIALVALFVALGGTGYAALNIANNSIGTKQLKRGAVKNPDLAANSVTGPKVKRRSLNSSDFKANSLPRGPQGEQGPVGPPGATGSPAFGAVLGRGEAVPAGTSFLAPSGQLAASGTENGVTSFTPNATLTASDLAISLFVAPDPGTSRTFTLRVGHADTALSCTVPAGVTLCNSTGSVTIPPMSLISIGSTTTGTPTPTFARFGWRATSG
jgi:hypothetical protein